VELSTVPAGSALIGVLVADALGRPSTHPTGAVRNATVAVAAVLSELERNLPAILRAPACRRRAQRRVAVAQAAARRVLDGWAHTPSGRRRAMLDRQAVELETIGALLRNAPPPAAASERLHRLAAVFEHLSDLDGLADTAGSQALVAIAAGDIAGAVAAYRAATRLRPDRSGVIALARSLLEAATPDAAGPEPYQPPPSDGDAGEMLDVPIALQPGE
jgi:hypothetical protein